MTEASCDRDPQLDYATDEETGPLGQSSPELIVSRARLYINAHLTDQLRPGQIAKALGVPVVDLTVSFRYVLGSTLHEDIMNQRINALHALIERSPQQDLHDLAEMIGLELNEVTVASFRERFWMTPLSWRDSCLKRIRIVKS